MLQKFESDYLINKHSENSDFIFTRIDGFHILNNQLRQVGIIVSNIEIFLPRKSTMNIERKQPNAVPSFNEDTIQEASSIAILKGKSSTEDFVIIGDVHSKNRPVFNWAKHTVLMQQLSIS